MAGGGLWQERSALRGAGSSAPKHVDKISCSPTPQELFRQAQPTLALGAAPGCVDHAAPAP